MVDDESNAFHKESVFVRGENHSMLKAAIVPQVLVNRLAVVGIRK